MIGADGLGKVARMANLTLSRRAALFLLPAVLAACGGQVERTDFPPLTYEYLTPIGLNVGSVTVEAGPNAAGPPGDIRAVSPVDPLATLRQMAQDRLKPFGSSGRAVLVINEISLIRNGDHLEGTLGVRLDVYSAGDTRAGFAEARVFRSNDTGGVVSRTTVYDLLKPLMEAMNVEMEFQIRHTLADWLAAAPGAAPAAPVQQQDLTPPQGS